MTPPPRPASTSSTAAARRGVEDLDNTTLYDASLFGWQTHGDRRRRLRGATTSPAAPTTYGSTRRTAVDELYEQLKPSTDPEEQKALNIEVESNLVADAFGLPIFQHPSITAYNSTYVDGREQHRRSSPTVFWNVWDWTAAS